MTDCCLHASNLDLTNWQGQEIGDTTQDLDPGVDENEDSFIQYPTDKIPGVYLESGDAELTGVDTDFDANPTGVKMDTGAYGEAYDAVPQKRNEVYQGNKLAVYGL